MDNRNFILTYDVGTTGLKTCLFTVSDKLQLISASLAEYPIYLLENGGVEQEPDDWWKAMKSSTKEILEKSYVLPNQIRGISFCSQMQGLVLVDSSFQPVRRAMSYMDQRAVKEIRKGIQYGFKVEGLNLLKLVLSLVITGAVAGSVKDPLWKYKWVKANEPENFSRVKWWFDVKEFLIAKCTNQAVMTEDSAFATFLFDSRKGKRTWSNLLIRLFKVNRDHMPPIILSDQIVGGLTKEAALELGLEEGTSVFGGGGDVSMIGVGAGAVEAGDTHVYAGTSGWVSTVTKVRKVDVDARIASIVGARPGYYNYFGEQETSGKCLQWVRDHLALDEIDMYLEKKNITDGLDAVYESLMEYMFEAIKETPSGSDGVIFAPWLHGNRCPFEDPKAGGIFFNIRLNTGKRILIRSVMEGILYHKRWILELSEKKIKTSPTIRFVGGVARSNLVCQTLADVTGKRVERVEHPENAGAMGAAALVALGLGYVTSFEEIKNMVPIKDVFLPNKIHKNIHDRNFKVFKKLYKQNKECFDELNENNHI